MGKTSHPETLVLQASAVAIEGRALLIEGEPGAGKSSLALALIERGAQLIGDDGVTLTRVETGDAPHIMASPPPNIEGLIEVRGVGLARFPVAPPCPVALILTLTDMTERLPRAPGTRSILGCTIPVLPFTPGTIAPVQRARIALDMHGALTV
ncbi:MAG: HPr kinase/phosphatase C-terminal domain-containing protein [Erythrobacter sp.]